MHVGVLNNFSHLKILDIKLITENVLTKNKQLSLSSFLGVFDSIHVDMLTSSAVEMLVQKLNYYSYLKEEYDPQDALSRIDNIKELIGALMHLETSGIKTISQFLDEVALMQEHYTKDNENKSVETCFTQ